MLIFETLRAETCRLNMCLFASIEHLFVLFYAADTSELMMIIYRELNGDGITVIRQ